MVRPKVLLVIALVVVFGLFGGGLLSIFGPEPSTDSDSFSHHGISGGISYGYDDAGVLGELMNSPMYVIGETMTAGGSIIVPDPSHSALGFCAYRFRGAEYRWAQYDFPEGEPLYTKVTTVTPSDWPVDIYSAGNPGAFFFDRDTWVITDERVVFVSFALFVEYSVGDPSILGNPCDDSFGWYNFDGTMFSADGANVFSGDGTVTINSPEPVPVGSDIVIGYSVGYASTPTAEELGRSTGWILQLKDPADQGGAVVREWNPEDASAGEVRYTVTSDMFVESTSNKYQVYLRNVLLNEDQTIFVTVSGGDGPPPDGYIPPGVPTLTFSHDGSHDKPWAGDTVTLNFRSEPGTNPIQSYTLTIDDTRMDVSQESHSFAVGGNEDIVVTVSAYDGQEKVGPVEITIDVGFAGEEEDFDFGAILIYVLIGAVALFALGIVLKFLPIPFGFKVMIFIVAIFVLPVVMFQFLGAS